MNIYLIRIPLKLICITERKKIIIYIGFETDKHLGNMGTLNLQKAAEIASQYFNLLIEKYRTQGYNFEVIRILDKKGPKYYIKFFNDGNDTKMYEIKNIH